MRANHNLGLKTTSFLADNFASAQEIHRWLQSLIGRPVPDSRNYFIEKVIAIQLDLKINRYTVKVLAAVKEKSQSTD